MIAADVNLIPGETTGSERGLELDENMNLTTLQPVIMSYTDFNDNTVENPNADSFIKAIEGKKLT